MCVCMCSPAIPTEPPQSMRAALSVAFYWRHAVKRTFYEPSVTFIITSALPLLYCLLVLDFCFGKQHSAFVHFSTSLRTLNCGAAL